MTLFEDNNKIIQKLSGVVRTFGQDCRNLYLTNNDI